MRRFYSKPWRHRAGANKHQSSSLTLEGQIPIAESMPYTGWVSATEALDFAGSESNCHPWCSCAIAGWQHFRTSEEEDLKLYTAMRQLDNVNSDQVPRICGLV